LDLEPLADAVARSRIEQLAMDAVRHAEESRGCHVDDVSQAKCGWDLTSHPPMIDGKQPEPRHIEVKGRVQGAATITVTRNEILYAFNQGDKFVLAIVLLAEDDSVVGPITSAAPLIASQAGVFRRLTTTSKPCSKGA